MTTIFFSPLSFVAVFGSGIRDPGSEIRDPRSGIRDGKKTKNQDPGSGINIPDPQHWIDVLFFLVRKIHIFSVNICLP
jgi:hypothetical protein